MINGRQIPEVMKLGTSFVCAHCERFWWGVDHDHDGCQAVHDGVDCSGPLRGMCFPYYKGPLERQLSKFCFVCGSEPSANAVAKKGGGRCGVCEGHLKLLRTHSAPGEQPPFVTHAYVPTVN